MNLAVKVFDNVFRCNAAVGAGDKATAALRVSKALDAVERSYKAEPTNGFFENQIWRLMVDSAAAVEQELEA